MAIAYGSQEIEWSIYLHFGLQLHCCMKAKVGLVGIGNSHLGGEVCVFKEITTPSIVSQVQTNSDF